MLFCFLPREIVFISAELSEIDGSYEKHFKNNTFCCFFFFQKIQTSRRVFEGFFFIKNSIFRVCSVINRDLTQKEGCKTQDDRMTKVFVRQDPFPVLRDIFLTFCRPESSSRRVAYISHIILKTHPFLSYLIPKIWSILNS